MTFWSLASTFAVASVTALSSPPSQNAPLGSCLLPDGRWCWPVAPAETGAPCECPTTDGLLAGQIN
ncbi:MAG: hypothetical protein AAFQ66_02340 [Pseudomonadota bacterium]